MNGHRDKDKKSTREVTTQTCTLLISLCFSDHLCMRKTRVHTNFYTAFSHVDSEHINAAVAGAPDHIRSLMSVYGCIYEEKSALKSPGYHVPFELKIRKMSGFNNSETAHVTFDPMSINACEKQVLLPAFYVKQHDIGHARSASYAKFATQSYIQLLLIHWKTAHMDFMYSWEMVKDERKLNKSDVSNTLVLCDRRKLLNFSPHHSSVAHSELCALIFCAHSSHSHSLSHATT